MVINSSSHFLLSLHFSILLSLCSAYTVPAQYFINCGSRGNITDNNTGRNFVGDETSPALSYTRRRTTAEVSNNGSPNTSAIYQTARIFRGPSSSYVFDLTDQGNYVVRLHFFPFICRENLSSSVFDVSVPGLSLLENFNVSGSTPVVKEFLLNISISKFVIFFAPKVSSFAFVNAPEVFRVVPKGFIPDSALTIRVSGNGSEYRGILQEVLRPVYRVNVGGQRIDPNGDNLRRKWESDDNYIVLRSIEENAGPVGYTPKYRSDVDKYLAPEEEEEEKEAVSVRMTWSR